MKLLEKTGIILSGLLFGFMVFCGNPSSPAYADDDTVNVNIMPTGVWYNGTVYTDKDAKIDVQSKSNVQFGYYAIESGWTVFGITFTESGTGVDKVLKTTLDSNYRVTLDPEAKVVYFRRTYVGEHTHTMAWMTTKIATKDYPGIETHYCTECMYVDGTRPIPYKSAPAATSVAVTLKNIPAGTDSVLELGGYCTLTKDDMALIRNANANITLKYVYNNKKYTVVIPKGKCYDMGVEFYGPEFMKALYNGTCE